MGRVPVPLCIDCGKEIVNATYKNRKICDTCANERKKRYMSRYGKAQRLLKSSGIIYD
jgi:hypothetical protein